MTEPGEKSVYSSNISVDLKYDRYKGLGGQSPGPNSTQADHGGQPIPRDGATQRRKVKKLPVAAC